MRGDLIEVFKIINCEDNNGNCNLVLHSGLATYDEIDINYIRSMIIMT